MAVLAVGAIAFGFFATLSGATSTAATPLVSTNPTVIANGEYLYNVHCSSCHAPGGYGSAKAPELYNVGAAAADFYLATGRMPLYDPLAQAQKATHPFFDAGQIQALVSYVADLPRLDHMPNSTGPGIPQILPLCPTPRQSSASGSSAASASSNPNCVTLSFGQQTFALNCEMCHQAVGAGGMLSKGDVVPSLQNASALLAAEAMRTGPLPMPKFGPGQLDAKQLSAVAQFVAYLNHPDNRGGLAISNFGPVAEGFVAIVIGFGFLLFVSRMIGTRA